MRARWRWLFLSITALAIGLELFAALDGNPDTESWTILIVTYIPFEVTFLILGGLSVWLFVHFGAWYWRRRKQP